MNIPATKLALLIRGKGYECTVEGVRRAALLRGLFVVGNLITFADGAKDIDPDFLESAILESRAATAAACRQQRIST